MSSSQTVTQTKNGTHIVTKLPSGATVEIGEEPATGEPPAESTVKKAKPKDKSRLAVLEEENNFLKAENKALESRVHDRDAAIRRQTDQLNTLASDLKKVSAERDEMKLRVAKRDRFASKEQAKVIENLQRKLKGFEKAQKLASANPGAKLEAVQKLAQDRLIHIQELETALEAEVNKGAAYRNEIERLKSLAPAKLLK